ncbi:hypothetical protein ACFTAO_34470 [Paenibacillus rhizoplanae]
MPVNYGQPPLDGLDMGSFEQLQKEMLHRHERQRMKESQQANPAKAQDVAKAKAKGQVK